MGVGNEPSNGTQEGEWFDLKMCGLKDDVGFVEGNVSVIFFIYIKVFNKSLS